MEPHNSSLIVSPQILDFKAKQVSSLQRWLSFSAQLLRCILVEYLPFMVFRIIGGKETFSNTFRVLSLNE